MLNNKAPQALDVEAAVLGAMLVEPSVVGECMKELTPSFFYDPKHRMVFEATTALVNERVTIDLISLVDKLRSKGNLEAVGGPVALADLTQNIGAAVHIEYYLKVLRQMVIRRDLIAASYETLLGSFDETVNVDDFVDEVETKFAKALHRGSGQDVLDVGSSIRSVMVRLQDLQGVGGPSGIPCGFPSIDRVTHGWQKSMLAVIGGDTSVGKTAFALNVARNAAVDYDIPVAYFSLGLVTDRITRRLVISESGLSRDKIGGSVKMEPFEWEQVEYTLKRLSRAPLYLDDTPDLTTSQFAAKAKRLVMDKGVRLVIVDCIQQMQGPRNLRDNRIQETAAIVRTLKTAAAKLGVPVIAISQLSRDVPKNAGFLGKPHLYDLRDSGTIENNADIVIFIHRPEVSGLSEDPADREKAWFVIAKNSDGETCDIEMKFKAGQGRFMEPDQSLDIRAERPYVRAASDSAEGGDGCRFEDGDQPF